MSRPRYSEIDSWNDNILYMKNMDTDISEQREKSQGK